MHLAKGTEKAAAALITDRPRDLLKSNEQGAGSLIQITGPSLASSGPSLSRASNSRC